MEFLGLKHRHWPVEWIAITIAKPVLPPCGTRLISHARMKQFAFLIAALTTLAATNLSKAADPTPSATTRTAIFAGGCFWCMQPPYDRAKGVVKTVVGYTGG